MTWPIQRWYLIMFCHGMPAVRVQLHQSLTFRVFLVYAPEVLGAGAATHISINSVPKCGQGLQSRIEKSLQRTQHVVEEGIVGNRPEEAEEALQHKHTGN